jgi:hypothetical protein
MKHILFLLALAPALALAQTGMVKDSVRVLTTAEISAGNTPADTSHFYYIEGGSWKKVRMDSLARFARVKLAGDRGDIIVSADGLTWNNDTLSIDSMQLGAGAVVLPGAKVTGTLPVSKGGTGRAALTANKVMVATNTDTVLTPTNLHWDNSNSRLGLGISSPTGVIHAKKDTAANIVFLEMDNQGANATGTRATVNFKANTVSGTMTGIATLGLYVGSSSNHGVSYITNGNTRMRIAAGGNVSIGTGDTDGAAQFHTTGTVRFANFAGGGTTTASLDDDGDLIRTSDSRLKKQDFQYNIEGISAIKKLQPVAYKWIEAIQSRGDQAMTELGFFADDVAQIIPSAAPIGNDGYYGFYDRPIIATLVKAMQEQQAIIEQLQQRIIQLENK